MPRPCSRELFQLQMRIPFPFLRYNDLRKYLLIMRTRIMFNLLYLGGKYARLVYTWYKNIFHMIAVLIVFLAVNEKKESDENNIKTRQLLYREKTVLLVAT